MIPLNDMIVRLLWAALLGAVIGAERAFHRRPAGLRTGLCVSVGAAFFTILSVEIARRTGDASTTRIASNIVQGIGFLGAGVIVRNGKGHHVHGLTTAACVWVTACIGAACACAEWQIVVLGAALVLLILVFGGPFEKSIDRRWSSHGPTDLQPKTPDKTRVLGSEM